MITFFITVLTYSLPVNKLNLPPPNQAICKPSFSKMVKLFMFSKILKLEIACLVKVVGSEFSYFKTT